MLKKNSLYGGRATPARRAAVALFVLGATLVGGLPSAAADVDRPPPRKEDQRLRLIVEGEDVRAARAAVETAGGSGIRPLSIIRGVSAEVPASAIPQLGQEPGVREVSVDGRIPLLSSKWGDDKFGWGASASSDGSWQADKDPGSLWSTAKWIGAHAAYSMTDSSGRPITGRGVDVAVLDSGVVPVAGLDHSQQLVDGPDLSFESQQGSLRWRDTFGHGTHMAGIIGGNGPGTAPPGDPMPYDNADYFAGIAPDSRLVSLKLATADGATDVSQVIAAVDWVVQNRTRNGLNIRVLNLSYGTDSVQDYQLDPLAYAVEVAWRKGIVVVVSAGNNGLASTRLTMPAVDPYVIAVGALDHKGTSNVLDDVVADFTNGGNSTRRPDLVAPGRSIVSLRNPGSSADVDHPEGRVSGDTSARFFRGSGTSQAAAVVSGAAALLLQQRPTLTPDQVKKLLTSTAVKLPADPSPAQGAGRLNVLGALRARIPTTAQTWPNATGLGSLEFSRGSSHVYDTETGDSLTGEKDVLGGTWDGGRWSQTAWNESSWASGTWNGARWTGDTWSSDTWSGLRWSGASWEGLRWSGLPWSGLRWSDASWDGLRWSGDDWSGLRWSGLRWSAEGWARDGWSGCRWF